MGVSLLRGTVYLRSAGIPQPDDPGHLVKGFSRRIISGFSQGFALIVILYKNNIRMASGHHQSHKRRLQFRIFHVIGRNMPVHVIHRHQRNILGKRYCFGGRYAHQQRAHQTRPVGNAD